MEENTYKVYALMDKNKCIVGIESTAFHDEAELVENGYIKIDEGSDGDIYGHAQPNYFRKLYGKPAYDEQMRCNFRYLDRVTELTEEEKERFFPLAEPELSEQERFNAAVLLELAKLKAGDAV
ncbi:MAG: hypothetical protein ACLTQJ_04520 [[Clostridium] innocuum]